MNKTKNLITIDKDQRLTTALEKIEKSETSRLLVTDEGKIIGIITEYDLGERLGTGKERDLKAEHIHVSSAMTSELVTISPDTEAREAAEIMLENNFSSLPIKENDEVKALVTKTDLIKDLKGSPKEVKNFYTPETLSVSMNHSLVSARKLMLENKVGRLVVMDKGKLEGILTKIDVTEGLKKFRDARDKYRHPDIEKLKVKHVFTPEPITCVPEDSVGKVAELMLENGISGIPVIGGEGIGIITKADLVRGIKEGELP